MAELPRAMEHWGRFLWQSNWPHKTLLGMHGTFLLCNGEVENAVTWNTDVIAEDYWFGGEVRYLGTCREAVD